jgi:hypothetical protein
MRSVIAALVLVFAVSACGDDDGSATTPSSAAPASTAAPTTETSTTTEAPTTTTEAPTTTTEAPTTTAAPDPTEAIVFSPAGLGVAALGDDPDAVIAALEALLGEAGIDTGWEPHPFVDGEETRSVVFGALWAFFGTTASPYGDAGTRHFQFYEFHVGEPPFRTAEGIGIGDTVDDLLVVYPDAELVQDNLMQRYRFQVHPAGTNDFLCFEVGFDEPEGSTPIEGITAGMDCRYGGE